MMNNVGFLAVVRIPPFDAILTKLLNGNCRLQFRMTAQLHESTIGISPGHGKKGSSSIRCREHRHDMQTFKFA